MAKSLLSMNLRVDLHGRRFSDGLHQAPLKLKKMYKFNPENQTLAQVTLQNYFRMYDKLSE